MIFRLEVWMTADQEARYRADRRLSPDEDVRPDVATWIHEEVAGAGELSGWWEAEINTRG